MPSQVRYEVLVPSSSLIAHKALSHASKELPKASISVEHNRGVYDEGQVVRYDVLHIICDESPHADSTIKQLAVYVAEATGVSPIIVSKSGKDGIQVWPMQHKKEPVAEPALS